MISNHTTPVHGGLGLTRTPLAHRVVPNITRIRSKITNNGSDSIQKNEFESQPSERDGGHPQVFGRMITDERAYGPLPRPFANASRTYTCAGCEFHEFRTRGNTSIRYMYTLVSDSG
ncbi:hypothetical protein WN55_00483 [Dufourea novaeangliae]|uniref:Uncharacterized protein n=1 Tax=Dufourea novaeangliae TaxID=178035 RepID=A0A154PDE3_DUFNO|nr:hypothetical protein WN55_00483 [Dufourea novaeangliae]